MSAETNRSDPARLARLAERAAAGSTAFLLEARRPSADDWTVKRPQDFVTEVDRGSERRIREDLLRGEPGSRILGEELSPGETDWKGLVWVVDPLDGTTNYLHGYPWWSVSIAAVLEGEIVAGTVWNVPAHRRYTAWKDGGAWTGSQRLRVSAITDPALAVIGTGFPFKTPEDLATYLPQLDRVARATAGVRRAGSAALDLAAVAAGEFDGFWELTLAPWDKAAGIILIREAGGVITELNGSPAGPRHGGVVAGNTAMHRWLRGEVEGRR